MTSIAIRTASAAKAIVLGLASAIILSSCTPEWEYYGNMTGDRYSNVGRTSTPERRKVMIMYSAGFNSLSRYLTKNIQDLKKGWLPENNRSADVLLIYSHLTESSGDYSTRSSPVLLRLYRGRDGQPVTDTLVIYPKETVSASAQTLNQVLSYIKEEFPAKGYGLLFSSHATGYLPTGFYSDPNRYVFKEKPAQYMAGRGLAGLRFQAPVPVPYDEPFSDPSLPAVKSMGQDRSGTLSYEIELDDFAAALPMWFDYILFDACLMGGIEVAYELKDKCGLVGFSQAEVLAEGFNYTGIASDLLQKSVPDPQKVCEDYFMRYDMQSGAYRSATISLVDCSGLDMVASVCGRLFTKYRSGLASVSPEKVQRFYRFNYHWFYDLESIISEAGADTQEMEELRDAIAGCIVYKAATPSFIHTSPTDGGFDILTHCGLTMYLPCDGNNELDKYYKTLKWNIDTGLVE